MEKLAIFGGAPVREEQFPLWPTAGKEELKSVEKVLLGQKWFAGPRGDDPDSLCELFGRSFAVNHKAEFGVPVSNGSVAIEIALRAVGVRPGDEVLVPSYTFLSSATSPLMVGAIPVFVDIDLDDYCMDPVDLENKITSKSKSIVVVHLGGQVAKMEEICSVAKKHGLTIVEDCAQSIGSTREDRHAGTWGDLGTFSFQSNKTITSGEGGLVMASDAPLAEKVRALTAFGRFPGKASERSSAYISKALSSNYRLSEMQAAVLLSQLDRFPEQNRVRQKNAATLSQLIAEIDGIEHVNNTAKNDQHGYYYYLLKYDKASFGNLSPERLCEILRAEGIPLIPGDERPLYASEAFQPANLEASLSQQIFKQYEKRWNEQSLACPKAEEVCECTILLRHQSLLGDSNSIEDIALAIDKVKANIHLVTEKQQTK